MMALRGGSKGRDYRRGPPGAGPEAGEGWTGGFSTPGSRTILYVFSPIQQARKMSDRIATLLQGRRERLSRVLSRTLAEPASDDSPLTPEARAHLLGDAQDLYWNELEWENLMEEEAVDVGEPLFELMFPGLLAYVRGLLLTKVMDDALAPASPRPVVVEDLLTFLAGRVLELEESLAANQVDDRERAQGELAMTDRLVDLVLYQYHGLSADDVRAVETASAG